MQLVKAFFVNAKHWQIFILLFVAPFAAQVVSFFITQSSFIAVMMMLNMLCFIAWFWSVGSLLASLLRTPLRMKLGLFHFALVYPPLYLPLFLWDALWSGSISAALIIPLHLVAMVCMVYLLYFVSKSLVMVETGKDASFYAYAGPLFLFWFYPVGIWFLQPRINRLRGAGGIAEQ